MTALVVCRVAHSFSLVSDKYIFTSPADIVLQHCLLSCSSQSLLCEGYESVMATHGLSQEYDRAPFPYGPQRWSCNNNKTQLHAWRKKMGGRG